MDEKKSHMTPPVEDNSRYPGVATDFADDDRVTKTLVAEDVKELNNNPRSSDGPISD